MDERATAFEGALRHNNTVTFSEEYDYVYDGHEHEHESQDDQPAGQLPRPSPRTITPDIGLAV